MRCRTRAERDRRISGLSGAVALLLFRAEQGLAWRRKARRPDALDVGDGLAGAGVRGVIAKKRLIGHVRVSTHGR